MSKRFTCTEKWERPWFRELSSKYKLLWFYILDKCDFAGIYYVDLKLAQFMLNEKFDLNDVIKAFNKQIIINGNRWLIIDFVFFQYGNSNKHKMFEKYNQKLEEFKNIEYRYSIDTLPSRVENRVENTVKDQVQVKDQVKDQEEILKPKSEFRELTDYYCIQYEYNFKSKFPFTSKDGKILSGLFKIYSLEDMKKYIEAYFKSNDKFYNESGYKTEFLKNHIVKYNSNNKPKQDLINGQPAIWETMKTIGA
jgi:hypothetical protein